MVFSDVRDEYLAVVSDAVRAFATKFLKLDYLNLGVWESSQCLDGNEIALLRVGERERKCIGWKQALSSRGIGKLNVRFDEVEDGDGCVHLGG